MPKRPKDFDERDRVKVLLWSDRHCCFCKKLCDVFIEVDHIDPNGGKGIDNAVPVCFDCHAKLHHYNELHPKGTKYRVEEIKARRNQIYEEFTRHLVPPINYQVTQQRAILNMKSRTFPDVGFILQHLGNYLPVKVITNLDIKLGGKSIGPPPDGGHYAGEKPWRLNPGKTYDGHFKIPESAAKSRKRLEVEVTLTMVDIYDYGHPLLPVGWVYLRDQQSWYFEP